jgi:hypothetical protein
MREGRFILVRQCLLGDAGTPEHHIPIVKGIDPATELDVVHRLYLAEIGTAWSSHQVPESLFFLEHVGSLFRPLKPDVRVFYRAVTI